DVIGPGRVWELEAPRQLRLQLEARAQGQLAFADLLRLDGPDLVATAGHSHFGSLVLFGPTYTREDADCVHESLAGAGLTGSASLLPNYGIGARLLANSADQLLHVFEGLVSPGLEMPVGRGLAR